MRILAPLFVLTSVAAGQARWNQLSPTTSPTPRAGMIAVTDGSYAYFFGGLQGASTYANDLWRFDGSNWTDVTPGTGQLPPARDWYVTAYDTTRSRLVVFGGRDAAGSDLGDLWEWNGSTWQSIGATPAPSPRRWASMTFDPTINACILFGGRDNLSGVYLNDTWAWDGTSWAQLSPGTSPTPRGRQVSVYDSRRGRIVMFGGRDSAALGETWEFRAGNWTQIPTATVPGGTGIYAFGLTYDPVRDRVVLFGGTTTGGTLANVWEFDGTDWTNRGASGPVSRTGCALTFVPALGKSYLFGGFQTTQLGDTWDYQTDDVAQYTLTGAGCAGSNGVPMLVSDELPWTQGTFPLQLQSLPTNAPALLILGSTQTQIPLAAFGAPGCSLLASLDVQLPMATSGNTATLGLPIPNVNALGGAAIYLQGVVVDPPANALDLVFSARGVATIGVR
ncbi:MAG: kelch repeat-containing protein [Planctomycetota bacterium]